MTDPQALREQVWATLAGPWDILIVGGGITGAGILREAVRAGLKALLVEQHDFGWGTSSRSSKLVHGGLRYLKEGRLRLTYASVRERDRLLEEGAGLIDPLGFLLVTHKGDHPGRRIYRLGLTVYDLLGLHWTHRYYNKEAFRLLVPHIAADGLQGGFRYGDAQCDDARLVLRVIQEAQSAGGVALNYVRAESLLREGDAGAVVGAVLRDANDAAGRTVRARATVVVNATGAWADRLRGQIGAAERIRPLRGSHLIFPRDRLPVTDALSFLHPFDLRPVFIFPWEGITLVGTTDVDHGPSLDDEPAISPEETAYLMAAVEAQFPSLALTLADVQCAFAGIRPVVGSGKANPSQESRDHVVWNEAGLLTVTGGKLTTFRRIALAALRRVRDRLPALETISRRDPALAAVDMPLGSPGALAEPARRRLLGRYGAAASAVVNAARPGELAPVPGTQTLWAELRWAARAESVVHLQDLMLRRTRLGLLLPDGGQAIFPALQRICREELAWDRGHWRREVTAYRRLWAKCYGLPPAQSVPDWRAALAHSRGSRGVVRVSRRRRLLRRTLVAGTVAGISVSLGLRWVRRRRRRR